MGLKESLESYMPGIFELLNEADVEWPKLNERFSPESNAGGMHHGETNYLLVEANLNEILSAAENGNESAVRLLGFMNTVLKRLSAHLLPEAEVMVGDAIRKMVGDPDCKFRNFVGEFAVLNAILERSENSLAGIGTHAIAIDSIAHFAITVGSSSTPELIEVANIQLDDVVDDLVGLLIHIVTEKILQKIGTGIEFTPFTLIPVIWAPVPVLQKLNQLYKSGRRLSFEHVAEPLAYCIFYTDELQAISRFGPISTLFDPFTEAQA
jgi:hypothetical protein